MRGVGLGGRGHAKERLEGDVLVGPAADELLDEPRVVRRLRADHAHAGQPRRLTQHRVVIPGIGQLVVEPDPERDPRAGRVAAGRDPARVDSQIHRFQPEELDSAGTVEHRGRKRRLG